VVSLVVYRATEAHWRQNGAATVASMVGAIEKTAAVGAYAKDRELLREIADGLRRHPNVAAVAMVDMQGQDLLPPSGPADLAAATRLAEVRRAAPAHDQTLSNPFDTAEVVGRLQVWQDEQHIQSEAGLQALRLVGALVVLLAAVLLVFQALAVRLLSRPMRLLAEDIAQMAPGTDARLQVDPRHEFDDIGTVAAAGNRLLALQQTALARERAMRAEIADMEARYRGIFDSSSAGIFVLSAGRMLHGNRALGRLLEGRDDTIAAAGQDDFVQTFACAPDRLQALIDAARESGQPQSLDLQFRRTDGHIVWAHCLVSVQALADGGESVEGVLYDITARRQTEQLAQHRAEHDALTGLKSRAFIEAALAQKLAVAATSDHAVTLMFLDLDGFKSVNDQWGHAAGDAVLTEAARRLRAIFKRDSDIVGRLGGDELVVVIDGAHALDPAISELAMALIAAFKVPFGLPSGLEARVGASVGVASYPRHATSAQTLIEAADAAMYSVKQSGKGGFVIANASDKVPQALAEAGAVEVAESRQEAAAEDLLLDPLTGLLDRRALPEKLERALARSRRSGRFSAVLTLDLDQFKLVNLTRGSRIGDEVLCEVARRLRAALRGEDAALRAGSDEFVVVIDTAESTAEGANVAVQAVATKLRDCISQTMAVGNGLLTVRPSTGISLLGPAAHDAQQALLEAQLALKRAKAADRGGLALFEPGMMTELHSALALEADLRLALAAGELELYVQPQVDACDRQRRGEALLRWHNRTRGWVAPDLFIAVAEASGFIVELGRWVLQQGCAILARTHRDGRRTELAINVSAAQFQHPLFVTDVRDAIAASGAPADCLILEITETLLIQQVDEVVRRMNELVCMGLRFAIDDFGTGFSSLGYLRRLPLFEIKIDRSFVQGLPDDPAAVGIVQSILAMGRHLGLEVVAEGVETAAQSAFLRAQGCPFEQGWLHGRPMPAEAWIESLAAPRAGGAPALTPPAAHLSAG
jgi:diguanylate cyclase (GGDEF)-like protein/PAS domain S-box-containing protein